MKKELMEWEREEKERKENMQVTELAEKLSDEKVIDVFRDKEKTAGDKVMDVVRAAELLVAQGQPETPKSPGGPLSADTLKTTTIVMSGHTLAPQLVVSKVA